MMKRRPPQPEGDDYGRAYQYLRERRRALGIPQRALSVLLGRGVNQIGRWESRSVVPSVEEFGAWCRALETTATRAMEACDAKVKVQP